MQPVANPFCTSQGDVIAVVSTGFLNSILSTREVKIAFTANSMSTGAKGISPKYKQSFKFKSAFLNIHELTLNNNNTCSETDIVDVYGRFLSRSLL